MSDPPAGEFGDAVTVLIFGARDRPYRSRDRLGPADLASIRLADGTRVPVPPGRAGVFLVSGDARPVLAQLFKDGLEFRSCGTHPECIGWTERFEALRDALGLGSP
jgi:hypothetical protein